MDEINFFTPAPANAFVILLTPEIRPARRICRATLIKDGPPALWDRLLVLPPCFFDDFRREVFLQVRQCIINKKINYDFFSGFNLLFLGIT